MVDGVEGAEGLHQVFHNYHIVVFRSGFQRAVEWGGEEDIAETGEYLIRRTYAFYLPLRHVSHAVAMADLIQIGCGSDDGDASVAELIDHRPELLAAHGVDAGGGFVEQKHLRTVEQGATQRELLLHTARELTGAALAEGFYLAVDVADAFVASLNGGAEEGGEETEVLLHAEVLIEGEATGHVAQGAAYLPHLCSGVEATDLALRLLHSAFRIIVGQQQRGKDAEHRGLAGAVGTDEAEDLAGLHLEGDILQGLHPAEVFGDVGDIYSTAHISYSLLMTFGLGKPELPDGKPNLTLLRRTCQSSRSRRF